MHAQFKYTIWEITKAYSLSNNKLEYMYNTIYHSTAQYMNMFLDILTSSQMLYNNCIKST